MKKLFLALIFVSTSVLAGGNLQISSQPIHSGVIPMNSTGIPMLEINLTAGDETIYLNKLIFNRTGLSSASDVKSIRATGANIRSRSFPMMFNDTATINFFGKLIIPAHTTQTLKITANLDVQGVGRSVGLDLVEIISSAETTNFGEPEPTKTPANQPAKSSSISSKLVEIEELTFKPSRLRLERWQKLGKFKLHNRENKSVSLDSIYLQHDGTGALENIFHSLVLTSRNKVISHMGKISSRSAKFSFPDDTNLGANSNRLLEVWGKVKRNKSTYSIDFRAENEDIITK